MSKLQKLSSRIDSPEIRGQGPLSHPLLDGINYRGRVGKWIGLEAKWLLVHRPLVECADLEYDRSIRNCGSFFFCSLYSSHQFFFERYVLNLWFGYFGLWLVIWLASFFSKKWRNLCWGCGFYYVDINGSG